MSLAPFGASWADPGRGNGRDDPPAHGRDQEDREEAQEEEASAADEEEAPGDERPAGEQRPTENDQTPPADEEQPQPNSDPSDSPGSRASYRAARADVIDASFSASPASISVGETSTLQITITNPSDTAALDVEVLVDLPAQLELVSAEPAPAGTETLSLALGDIAPGAATDASLVVMGVDADGAGPVRFAVTADGQTFHHELFIEVGDSVSEGVALSQSSPLLLQVGDAGSFSATVSNTTDTALNDVVVVSQIAPELDVLGVTPIVEADAIQLGATPGGEDIVWVFETLAPGEEVNMTWTSRAAAPGDLEAGNEVTARIAGAPAASSTQQTYLGYVRGVRTDRSVAPAPVVREQVVTKLVPVSTEVAAGVGGGVLPVTGWSPSFLGFGGIALIALGGLLVWVSRGLRSRRLALVLTGALLLTATACVSDEPTTGGSDGAAAPAASPSVDEDPGEVETKEEEKDEVLGLRIKRPEGARGPDAPGGDPIAEPPVEPVTQVVYEEVSEVVSVVVPVAELPLETLASTSGDNTLSFSWTAGDLQATSGRVLSADATEELLVGISSDGDGLTATVEVANLADDRRLRVAGRLTLEVVASDGRSASLTSAPIDVVLDPGASTVADLTFSLPSGSYTAKGTFLAD
jgi:uncharacterized repeat protein (TIGR01451 family)